MDKEKSDALRLQITAAKNKLQDKKGSFLMGIWLGYSAVVFALIYLAKPYDSLLGMLLASLVIGAVLYVINAGIWSACYRSIFETEESIKKMEKEYADLINRQEDSEEPKENPVLYKPIIDTSNNSDIETILSECERTYYKLISNKAVHRCDRYTDVTAAYICFMVDISLSKSNVVRETRAKIYRDIVNMMIKLDILDSAENEVFIDCFNIHSKVATGELRPHGKWMTNNAEGNDRQLDWNFDNFLCYGDLLKYPSCRKDYLAPPSELPDPLSDTEFAAEFGKTHTDIMAFVKVISIVHSKD